MKIYYKFNEIIGDTITKYGITFNKGEGVRVDNEAIIDKLLKSPYLSNESEVEEVKPKRKYNKKPKDEENEAQAEAEATPEAEVKGEE